MAKVCSCVGCVAKCPTRNNSLVERLKDAREQFLKREYKKISKQLVKAARKGRYRLKKKFVDAAVAQYVFKRFKDAGVRVELFPSVQGGPMKLIVFVQ